MTAQWQRHDWTVQAHSWGPQEGMRPIPMKVNSTKPIQHAGFGLWPAASFHSKWWLVKSSKKQDCSTSSCVHLTWLKSHLWVPFIYWKARTGAANEAFGATESSSGLLWGSDCPKNDGSRPVNTIEHKICRVLTLALPVLLPSIISHCLPWRRTCRKSSIKTKPFTIAESSPRAGKRLSERSALMGTCRLFKAGRGIPTTTALRLLIERHHKEKA